MADRSSVIVVGGGPVGVVTALLLAQRGFTVTVLEKATEIYDLPRAIVMDDEIQRILHDAGLGPGLAGITTPLKGAEFVSVDGERIMGAELPLDADWPLGHHPNVTYYQPELESFFRRAAQDAGVVLQLGVHVDGVEQSSVDVTVSATGPDGERREYPADWLVAADGASSPIRKSLGIEFVSQGFDQDWLVLDLELERPVDTLPRFVQQVCDPARPTTVVPGHADYRRWEFQLQPGESREEMVEPGHIWAILQPWLTPEDARLIRAVVYRFHATVADRMREGRIFLAGDAAHQMPPFLGQGLCSGVRDSANLAWKLDLFDRGLVGEAALDTYSEERLPHAAGVVAHAVDTGRLIDQLAGRESHGVDLDAAYGGGRPFPHLEHGLLVGEAHVVGRQLHHPTGGDHQLGEVLGHGFAVVTHDPSVVAPEIAERWESIEGTVVTLASDALTHVVPEGGAVIVRPDRIVAAVAAVAADASELADATTRLFGLLGCQMQH